MQVSGQHRLLRLGNLPQRADVMGVSERDEGFIIDKNEWRFDGRE